ncbi:methylmalonyl-CoA mutase family protein [Streptomyces sp. AC154]|uniref:methylmalonyl-CoA mutase family protein n=1 Tax=Streptomyces sp. AC154 TaxID=3143184 RepID=UPI003F7E2E60
MREVRTGERGVYPPVHTGRPWTMRQYAGSGTATESNARYKELIANGTTGLSVAFDLPTQMGHDSDTPAASGKVGRAGVAIDSIDDVRVLFGGIPLDKVCTSMTINGPAAPLLLMYQLVGEEQGVPADRLTGTIQKDVLKEYIARGTSIFPPEPSLRLIADIFGYCRAEIPKWNTISISGCHLAEAGASPAQEIAFTLSDGIEYVRTGVAAGMDVDDLSLGFSFLFARTTPLAEAAKFGAARRIWARVMGEEFGARNPESLILRLQTRTAGARLTGRRPEVNPVRAADSTLPAYAFAGSDVIEKMTDDVERAAVDLMRRVEELGGAVSATEHGFQKVEIERSVRRTERDPGSGGHVAVGADCHRPDEDEPGEPLRVDPAIEARQAERLAKLRAWRCGDRVRDALIVMRRTADGEDNVLYPMKEALAAGATVGEVCTTLREVWGPYTPSGTQRCPALP